MDLPDPDHYEDWKDFARALNSALKTAQVQDFTRLKVLPLARIPTAKQAGILIQVSNEAGGAVPAFSDGTNFRRVTDRAVVS